MMVLIAVLFALVNVCPAVAAQKIICHDESGSLVFDDACDLTSAANGVAVSRFTYDGHRVTRAETLIGEAVFDVAWQRDAGGLVTNIDYGCGYSVLG